MSLKKYTWKVFGLDGTFKFTINPRDIKRKLQYQSSLNAGQWQFTLLFNKPIDWQEIVNTDIIKIYQIDKSNPDWRILYTWIVQNVIKRITANYEEIEIPLLWLWSIFTYKTYNGSFDDTPWNIVSAMVDLVNTDYNLFTKDIDTSGANIKLDLEYETALNIVSKVKQASYFNYRICADWVVCFKNWWPLVTHNFQIWKEVFDLQIKQNTENLVNKLHLTYDWWSRTYEDLTSQITYWLREKHIRDTSIKQHASADEFWTTYISNNKNPKAETVVKINDLYDIESIKPWHWVSIYWTEIQDKQIVKLNYYSDWIDLYLEEFESFGKFFI